VRCSLLAAQRVAPQAVPIGGLGATVTRYTPLPAERARAPYLYLSRLYLHIR
jgi:hypothetical protein